MNKIKHAIQFNVKTVGTSLGWIGIFDDYLSDDTKKRIENSNIELVVLARIIVLTMNEVNDYSQLDKVFNSKINDQSLVIRLKTI